MANIASLADKLSELNINNAEAPSASTSASKLPTKFQGLPGTAARPPPGAALKLLSSKTSNSIFTPPSATSLTANATASTSKTVEPTPTSGDVATAEAGNEADIGAYDGGFETEVDGGRGSEVYGEAADDLALDSSKSR